MVKLITSISIGAQMSEQSPFPKMPEDIIKALQHCLDVTQNPARLTPEHGWLYRKDAWAEVLAQAIKEFKELKEQYEIQNDNYSRLMKQVYGGR